MTSEQKPVASDFDEIGEKMEEEKNEQKAGELVLENDQAEDSPAKSRARTITEKNLEVVESIR